MFVCWYVILSWLLNDLFNWNTGGADTVGVII
jgi:hypothetical protein